MLDINLSFEIQMVIVIKLLTRKNRKSTVHQDVNAVHDSPNFYDNFNKLLISSVVLQICLKNVQMVLAMNNALFCSFFLLRK